jgi:poly-gamma-glutamate synthesis protein (capsule biosynthesis protein)
MNWQPILDGARKARALDGVRAVVKHLAPSCGGAADDPSLESGSTAMALLHAAVAQSAGEDDESTADAIRCLRHARDVMRNGPGTASLYGGLPGVGWAIAHLRGWLPGLDGEEDLAEIDGVLLDHLEQSPWSGTFDLIDGLLGVGVYALERLESPTAVACLKRVVERLAETAEPLPSGITWTSLSTWLAPEYRDERPLPYFDLGLAHGVPGVIAFLARVCAAGIDVARARPLLDGAVGWLLNQGIVESRDAVPSHVGPGIAPVPACLGYAYGDLGIAVSLLMAARAVSDQTWEDAAVRIALRAAAVPSDRSGVVQAGLYKGAAGVGHVFNRLFQAKGDERLGEAARFWFRRTLAMRSPVGEAAGFFAWGPGAPGGPPIWLDNPRFLTGTTGIALALLGAATTLEPTWDRLLLVSIPPGKATKGGRLAVVRTPACEKRFADQLQTSTNHHRVARRASSPGTATLAFLGDLMLGRGVSAHLARRPPGTFWGDVLPQLHAADVVFANLECAITERTKPWQNSAKGFHFRADPRAVEVLRAGQIRCVSLANNHTMDFGEEGLLDTIRYLDDAGIRHAGAGRNISDSEAPAFVEAAGLKVGVIAVVDEEPAFAAGNARAGTNSVNIARDPGLVVRIAQAAAQARRQGAQFVVLSVHWGTDIALVPAAHFRTFARAAIENGVDLVYGHADHVFQGVEVHGKGLILYGTGDFLDDYAVDPLLRYDWTFLFQVHVDACGIQSVDLVPVILDFAQSQLARGADFEVMTARMCRLCAHLGTPLRKTAGGLQVRVRQGRRVSAGVSRGRMPVARRM